MGYPSPCHGFSAHPQDICICIAYFSRTFTHQIIRVHPRDSLEIPHFSWVIYLDLLSGFPHIPGTCTAFLHVWDIFIQAIYPPIYLSTSRRCSENYTFFPNIYLDTNSVFSWEIYPKTMSLFPVILLLPDLKSDALENLAFFRAIYMDPRVTSLLLSIGPNHYL